MTISVVQSKYGDTYTAGWTADSFPTPITPGNTVVVVGGGIYNNGTFGATTGHVTSAPTLDGNAVPGAYQVFGQDLDHDGFIYHVAWVLPNCPAASTFNMTAPAISINAGWMMYEVAGLGPKPKVSASAGLGGDNRAPDSGPITPPDFPCFVAGSSGLSNNGSADVPASPWVSTAITGNISAGYLIPTSAGTYEYNHNSTSNATETWIAMVFALAPSGNPGAFFQML